MIQTQFGAVPLRRPRALKEIQLHACDGRAVIQRDWLKHCNPKSEEHRISVKQALLIACTQMEIEDLSILQMDPATGAWRTPEFISERRQQLDRKLDDLETERCNVARRSGRANVATENLQKQVNKLKKHMLTKRSAKCGAFRMRWFTIEDGKLLVYKSDSQHAEPKKTYNLDKAKCTYEYSKMPNMPSGESFMSGKDHRICLLCKERPHGPMYLYPDEADASKAAKQAKSWERACRMSKYLKSAPDKQALSFVVQAVIPNVVRKGWFCLVKYKRMMDAIKSFVSQVGNSKAMADWTDFPNSDILGRPLYFAERLAKLKTSRYPALNQFMVDEACVRIMVKILSDHATRWDATNVVFFPFQPWSDETVKLLALEMLHDRQIVENILATSSRYDTDTKTEYVQALFSSLKLPLDKDVCKTLACHIIDSSQPIRYRALLAKQLCLGAKRGDTNASIELVPMFHCDDNIKSVVIGELISNEALQILLNDSETHASYSKIVCDLGMSGNAKALDAFSGCWSLLSDTFLQGLSADVLDDDGTRGNILEIVLRSPGLADKLFANFAKVSTDYYSATRRCAVAALGIIAAENFEAELLCFNALSDMEMKVQEAASKVFTIYPFAEKFPKKAISNLLLGVANIKSRGTCEALLRGLLEGNRMNLPTGHPVLSLLENHKPFFQTMMEIVKNGFRSDMMEGITTDGNKEMLLADGSMFLCAFSHHAADFFFQQFGLQMTLQIALEDGALKNDGRFDKILVNLAEASLRDYTLLSMIMDSGLPIVDYLFDIANAVTFYSAEQFGFLASVGLAMTFNTLASCYYMVVRKYGENRYSKVDCCLHVLSLGVYGYCCESRYCGQVGLQTDLLTKFKLCEAFESVVSFMIGVYSLLLAGFITPTLPIASLCLRWLSIASSLALLPHGLVKTSNKGLLYRFLQAHKSRTPTCYFEEHFRDSPIQASLYLFHFAEVAWLITLLILQFVFRPWGIFIFGAVYWLVVAIGTAHVQQVSSKKEKEAREEDEKEEEEEEEEAGKYEDAVAFSLMTVPLLMVMNPVQDLPASLDSRICIFRCIAICAAWICVICVALLHSNVTLLEHLSTCNALILVGIAVFGSILFFVIFVVHHSLGRFAATHAFRRVSMGRRESYDVLLPTRPQEI